MTPEADVRVEEALPNRVRVPGRTRHASPSVATFRHGEADECASAERICIGSDDQLRASRLPWGGLLVGDDRDGPPVGPSAWMLGSSKNAEGLGPTALAAFARIDVDAGEQE